MLQMARRLAREWVSGCGVPLSTEVEPCITADTFHPLLTWVKVAATRCPVLQPTFTSATGQEEDDSGGTTWTGQKSCITAVTWNVILMDSGWPQPPRENPPLLGGSVQGKGNKNSSLTLPLSLFLISLPKETGIRRIRLLMYSLCLDSWVIPR